MQTLIINKKILPMVHYYDYILGAIPLALALPATALVAMGIPLTQAIPAASILTFALIGHAMFIRTPTDAIPLNTPKQTPTPDLND